MSANPHTLMIIYGKDANEWEIKAKNYRALAKAMHLKANKNKLLKEARYAEAMAKKFRRLEKKYKAMEKYLAEKKETKKANKNRGKK